MNTKLITLADVVTGARFKIPGGTIFIIDKVEDDQEFGKIVSSSYEGGAKGNYKDLLSDAVAFLNEENATKI